MMTEFDETKEWNMERSVSRLLEIQVELDRLGDHEVIEQLAQQTRLCLHAAKTNPPDANDYSEFEKMLRIFIESIIIILEETAARRVETGYKFTGHENEMTSNLKKLCNKLKNLNDQLWAYTYKRSYQSITEIRIENVYKELINLEI